MKTVNFSYKSIGNFVKLLATIKYEKQKDPVDVAIWHERFDEDEADSIFESFLVELFPNGKVVDIEDIDAIIFRAEKFMDRDKRSQDIRNKYIKLHNTYWVEFKPDNIVLPCRFCEHSKVVKEICVDYFKDFDPNDISVELISRFIKENFTIKSDNSTIEKIARDARYIAYSIVFARDEKSELLLQY